MEYKNIEFNEISLTYGSLLEMLKNKAFTQTYSTYISQQNFFCYKISRRDLLDKPVIIFKNKLKIIIHLNNKKEEIIFARSNVDIKKFCIEKSININLLLLNDTEKFEIYKFEKYYNYINGNVLNLYFPNRKELSNISAKSLFNLEDDYKVSEYSSYYKDYFDDDNLDPNYVFKFENNETRKEILGNMLNLQTSSLNTFKFTGPLNTGKSITLLEYSRTCENAFYINLKILKNKPIYDCYTILQEEFSRISEQLFEIIQNIIKSNYTLNTPPLNLIVIIMDILKNEKQYGQFLFALDQYKEDIFSLDLLTKLKEKRDNIKIVYCSSINEKKIRFECLETWKNFENSNPVKLNEQSQNYYFYYTGIYSKSILKANSPIEEVINIKRFKKYYNIGANNEEKILKIKNHINEKMAIFSKKVNMSFDHMIVYIKNIINKKYSKDELEKIISYCPLKYFVIKFKDNYFKIKVQFSLMNQILNRELYESEIYNYFDKKKYSKNLKGNKAIKDFYFEEAVKKGLRKENFLPLKSDHTLELQEILSIDKIEGDSMDNDYLEDKLEGEEEEESNDYEDSDMIIENPKVIEEKKEKSKDMGVESNYSENSNLLNLTELLNKFSLEDINNEDNEDDVILNKIEYYREDEIQKLRKNKDNKFTMTKRYTGDETLFLTQKSKNGRAIDCAYLYGKKKDKTFIAFQIKCLFNTTTSIKPKTYKKDIIKRNLQKILIKSMYLLNCRINHWFYYLIFYYNPTISSYNVNKQLIDKLKNYIEIIFYEPLKKKFYDCKHKEIDTLPFTDNANLDIIKESLDKYKLNEQYDFKEEDDEKLKESFENIFKYMNLKDEKEIIKKISIIMKIKKTKIIELKLKRPIKYSKIEFPNYDAIFIYEGNNKGCYGVKIIKDKKKETLIKIYDLKQEDEVTPSIFYKNVNLKKEMYVLEVRNRVHNDVSKGTYNYIKGKKILKANN